MNFTRITQDDLEFLNQVRNLYASEYLHDSRTFTLEETKNWYLLSKPDYRIIWEDEKRVGYFRLSNYSKVNNNIYIGADIHPTYANKGIGYRAYTQFIPMLFEENNLNKISLEVLSTNKRAIHLYKKLGFLVEGIKREETLKNGVYIDSIIMSILKKEIK